MYFVEGKTLNSDGLSSALVNAAATGRKEIVIRGDQDTDYKHIVNALNLCNQAGLVNHRLAIAD